MDRETLENKIAGYSGADGCEKAYEARKFADCTLQRVRDKLLDLGEILEEDLDGGMYVAHVEVGPAKASSATLATGVGDEAVHALAYSEGPGGTGRATEAVRVFLDAMEGKVPEPRRRHGALRVVLLALLAVAFLAAIFWALVGSHVAAATEATNAYNEAIEGFNEVVPAYNAAVEGVALDNIRGLVPEAELLTVQPTDALSIARQVIGGNDADKITADAQTVRDMTGKLGDDLRIVEAIDNPDGQWVANALIPIESISAVETVTDENDPNGLLGKDGGYTSCVYFTTTMLDASGIAGDNPVAKGVDGGGAVEVYATADDARARCEYLAGFDGTILYSGSYALVGTMVVRTSCLLADDAQYELTDEIVTALTQ